MSGLMEQEKTLQDFPELEELFKEVGDYYVELREATKHLPHHEKQNERIDAAIKVLARGANTYKLVHIEEHEITHEWPPNDYLDLSEEYWREFQMRSEGGQVHTLYEDDGLWSPKTEVGLISSMLFAHETNTLFILKPQRKKENGPSKYIASIFHTNIPQEHDNVHA